MKYEKYLIKKGKQDLLSSLKALDKSIVNKMIKENDLKDVEELKKYILEDFEDSIEMFKDNIYTRMYFERLLDHENTEWMSAYQEDIEDLLVFVYKNGNHYSYYIPTEIKEIIIKILRKIPTEEKINLENAANTPIIKDLKVLLNSLTVKNLKHIGELFLINRLSNKPKKELANIIYNALTSEEKLSEVIERFIDKEFNLLKELITNNGTIQDNNISIESYHFLYMLGIVSLFKRSNKFYISMTDDVYNTISKIKLNEFNKIIEENSKAYNLIRAMVELYGVISYGELDYYYSLYYGDGEELDIPNNSLYFCDRCDHIGQIHTKHNLYFVNRVLNNDKLESILDDIIERQQQIKRKPIDLEELLKYSNYDYYENTESKNKFKKYLKNKNISDDIIEELIKMISQIYRLGNSFIGATFEMLEDYGILVNEQNMQEILNYLIEIYNSSRIWVNNGWTPVEMREGIK